MILSFTSVDICIAYGALMFIRGANLSLKYPPFLPFPPADVSLARAILRFTSVDVSIGQGALMFIRWANLASIRLTFLSFAPLMSAVLPW